MCAYENVVDLALLRVHLVRAHARRKEGVLRRITHLLERVPDQMINAPAAEVAGEVDVRGGLRGLLCEADLRLQAPLRLEVVEPRKVESGLRHRRATRHRGRAAQRPDVVLRAPQIEVELGILVELAHARELLVGQNCGRVHVDQVEELVCAHVELGEFHPARWRRCRLHWCRLQSGCSHLRYHGLLRASHGHLWHCSAHAALRRRRHHARRSLRLFACRRRLRDAAAPVLEHRAVIERHKVHILDAKLLGERLALKVGRAGRVLDDDLDAAALRRRDRPGAVRVDERREELLRAARVRLLIAARLAQRAQSLRDHIVAAHHVLVAHALPEDELVGALGEGLPQLAARDGVNARVVDRLPLGRLAPQRRAVLDHAALGRREDDARNAKLADEARALQVGARRVADEHGLLPAVAARHGPVAVRVERHILRRLRVAEPGTPRLDQGKLTRGRQEGAGDGELPVGLLPVERVRRARGVDAQLERRLEQVGVEGERARHTVFEHAPLDGHEAELPQTSAQARPGSSHLS
eukprot:128271-Prymnesium_polylepis.3